MNRTIVYCFVVLSCCLAVFSCQEQKKKRVLHFSKTDLSSAAIIPKPLKIVPDSSAFALDQFTGVYISNEDKELNEVGSFLTEKLLLKTGLSLLLNPTSTTNQEGVIYIEQSDKALLNPSESYTLRITNDSIVLSAKTAEAAFRGVQTLRQLIPEKANDTLAEYPIYAIPTGTITDKPAFEYRGTMLDVARHFFAVEDLKKYIDILAYYKYNVLHLHLSDDQGWRIEIKSWPLLTEIGGRTAVGGGKGGFYTQEDYKEIVAYAAKHHITIVPEIDMPGHTSAASAAYPVLNGNGKEAKIYTGMRVGFSTFDTRKELVYQFIDDVVGEISAMTPGPYFHIGGDESEATKKNDYIYFVERVEKIVQKHGKQMIGWDEIGQANLSSSSISQFWRHADFANLAIEKKMKLIMSPAKHAYLDMKYDSLSKHGLRWAGYIPVKKAYDWHPEGYEGIDAQHILGIEAPLWSETITNIDELEYLAFPRAIGYAELGWTTKENRNWQDYNRRLVQHKVFLDSMKVNYYKSPLINWDSKKYN